MKSLYIAAPYATRHLAIGCMLTLEAHGVVVTSTWLREEDIMNDQYATLDLNDVARADALLAMNIPGWEEKGTGGRHVEFGYALALNKKILLMGKRSHIFHHLHSVVLVEDTEQILAALR